MASNEDEPTVDLLDQRGRLRRFAVAVVAGATAALVAGAVAYWLSDPDHLSPEGGQVVRAWRFIFYVAGLAGAIVFTLTQVLLSRRSRRQLEEKRIPRARVAGRS
jgi:MFS family permease